MEEGREAGLDHVEVRARLATTQVGDGPGDVAEEGDLGLRGDEAQEAVHAAFGEEEVAALGGVTGDVAQGPDSLLCDVRVGGSQQLDEHGYGTLLDHVLRVLRRTGGDVGQGPRCLKLEGGVGEGAND